MFKITENIEAVDLFQFGEKMVPNLGGNSSSKLKSKLPLSFFYNESWNIKHDCECGASLEKLRFDYNPNERFPKYSYSKSEACCTKYYPKDFLIKLNNLFKKSNIINTDSIDAIIYDGKIDSNFPIFSSIKLALYSCDFCTTGYLAIINNFSPRSPEKEHPKGLKGKLEIKEIVGVKLNKNIKIETLFKEVKK